MAVSTRDSAKRRSERTRIRLRKLANGRPRLSVFRSSKNIYAQVIDDEKGVTLASASTLETDAPQKGSDKAAAARIGALVAQRALEKGVTDVVFDRGGYIYHGRVKALADAAREAGISSPKPPATAVETNSVATADNAADETGVALRTIAPSPTSSRNWFTSTALRRL